jgi:protein transport protein SEC61 subunit gamma and related proteins
LVQLDDMEKEGFKEVLIEPLKQFAKDSIHLVKKCTKPDRKEFTMIARATGVGFLIMGFIGFFVKLVHIPINNILVGS